MTDTLPATEQRRATAVQLERALLAARRSARLSGDLGLLPALNALAYHDVSHIDVETLRAGSGPRWRRFADVVLVTLGQDPLDPRAFVDAAPLPAVDAYIDLASSSIEPSWWSGRPAGDRLYLTARTRPGELADQDVASLGWWEEFHRRRLASGLPYQASRTTGSELFQLLDAAISGNITVLDRLVELLPDHHAATIHLLRQGTDAGDWPSGLADDRGLWLLMLRLWAPRGIIRPSYSAFHRWAAFRHCYDLTLAGDYEEAWSQIDAFPSYSKPATRLQKEVDNLRAYLTLVRSSETSALNQAMAFLRVIHNPAAARSNQEMVRRMARLTTNERRTCENPYLVFGVPHGSRPEVWKVEWRRARAENSGDIDALSRVNEAKDAIMALERDGSDGSRQVFLVPLEARLLTPHLEWPSRRLVPGLRAYPNRTSHLLEAAVQSMRSDAIRELASAVDQVTSANGKDRSL